MSKIKLDDERYLIESDPNWKEENKIHPLRSNVDMVDHPPHYNTGKFEVIDVLADTLGEGFEKFCIGNALKYLMRYEHKGKPLEDLEKAAWYLNRAIEKRRETGVSG